MFSYQEIIIFIILLYIIFYVFLFCYFARVNSQRCQLPSIPK